MVTGEDHHQLRTANGPENMAALRNLATRPHTPGPRPQCLQRLDHHIPVTTTKTRHQATHPTNHLNRLCRPPVNDPLLVQNHVVPGTPSSCWMRASLCRCLTVDRLNTLTKAHVGREVGVALVGAVTLL